MATIPEALAMASQSYQSGNLSQAEHIYRQVLQADPRNAKALFSLGVMCQLQGKLDEAIGIYRQLLTLTPNNIEAHNNMGIALQTLGRLDEAVVSIEHALRLKPDFTEAHNNMGITLLKQGKAEEAVASYRKALRFNPQNAQAHNNMGNALRELKRLDDARASLEQALKLKPDFAEAHNNLGTVIQTQGHLSEAVACYEKAIRLNPNNPEAFYNRGDAFRKLGRLDDALASYDQAVRLNPNYPEANVDRALVWLTQGNLEQGWAGYEWRWRCTEFPMPAFKQPLWDGSDLQGRTLLVHVEQGLGDTIQFIRYAPLVKERCGTLVVQCQPPLVPLLRSRRGIDRLVPRGKEEPPDFDVHSPLLSLPRLLGTTLATVPADVPYLHPDPALVEHWGRELGPRTGFRVGIGWQGNPQYPDDRDRSMPLSHFAALARVEGVQLFSLQKGFGREQIEQLAGNFPVIDLADRLDETGGAFMDTAAVIRHLDLVITSDTALPHVAGAIAAPVWVALPYAPNWRWLLKREDCPWYPTMRLFRQQTPGTWEEVFERIAAELKRVVGKDRARGLVSIEVAPGELIDKITILQIKNERMTDPEKLRNVRTELATLDAARERSLRAPEGLNGLAAELKAVNEALWQIEDDIRSCEREADFGPRFVELARSVYHQNDRRSAIKRRINELLGSAFKEEKNYAPYGERPPG